MPFVSTHGNRNLIVGTVNIKKTAEVTRFPKLAGDQSI